MLKKYGITLSDNLRIGKVLRIQIYQNIFHMEGLVQIKTIIEVNKDSKYNIYWLMIQTETEKHATVFCIIVFHIAEAEFFPYNYA